MAAITLTTQEYADYNKDLQRKNILGKVPLGKDNVGTIKIIPELTIKSCDECPYDDWDCHHPKVKFRKHDDSRNSAAIPDWCPLQDVNSERNTQLSDYI